MVNSTSKSFLKSQGVGNGLTGGPWDVTKTQNDVLSIALEMSELYNLIDVLNST